MRVDEILLFVLISLWIVLHLMSIDDDVRAIKYEQHEIYLLLEYYLRKREVEREREKEANKKAIMDAEWYEMMESMYAGEREKKHESTIDR